MDDESFETAAYSSKLDKLNYGRLDGFSEGYVGLKRLAKQSTWILANAKEDSIYQTKQTEGKISSCQRELVRM